MAKLAGVEIQQIKKIIAEYNYIDEQGNLLFQTVRCSPKSFFQRRPDGNGGWVNNLSGVRLVPYNLPAVIKSDAVYILEGEKDVDAIIKMGLVGTTAPIGAGKWRAEYNQFLKNKKITIIPDTDPPGLAHAETIAKNLFNDTNSLKILKLSTKDISDWIEEREKEGKNITEIRAELLELIEQTPEWKEDIDLSICPTINTDGQTDKCDKKITSLNPYEIMFKGSYIMEMNIFTEWVVEKLIPKEGISLLYGRGGAGKTTLSMQIANAVTKGQPFLGLSTTKLPVVYIDFENPLSVLSSRIKSTEATEVYFWTTKCEITPPKIDENRWELYNKLERESLLIFDTLRSANSGEENTSQPIALYMDKFRKLRDKGHTIIVLHHSPKGNDNIYKGNTSHLDLVDHVLGLTPIDKNFKDKTDGDIEDCYFRLGTSQKTRYEPFHLYVAFNPETKLFETVPDPDTETLQQMYSLLAEQKSEVTQQKFFELARENLLIKSKGIFIRFLNKGEGKFWEKNKKGNAFFYTPLENCPKVQHIYSMDSWTDATNPPEITRTDTTEETPPSPLNKELSVCPDHIQTVETNCKEINFEDLKLQVESGQVFNTENSIKKAGDI